MMHHFRQFAFWALLLFGGAWVVDGNLRQNRRDLVCMARKLHSLSFRKEGDAHVDACVFPLAGAI